MDAIDTAPIKQRPELKIIYAVYFRWNYRNFKR